MRVRVGLIVAFLLWSSSGGFALAEERIAVVVRADREVALSLADVAQVFLKKRRFWSGGDPIVPVNRDAASPLRSAFTSSVFEAQVRFFDVYWNRQYFQGVLPPITLASDAAVLRYVASEPGAIGYVSMDAVDDSVRVVLVLDSPGSK